MPHAAASPASTSPQRPKSSAGSFADARPTPRPRLAPRNMIARARAMFKTARPDSAAPPTRRRLAAGGQREESNKLHGEAAELAEIGVQRVAFLGEHHARERTGEDQMAGLERDTQRAELVGEPGDAERGMAEHR